MFTLLQAAEQSDSAVAQSIEGVVNTTKDVVEGNGSAHFEKFIDQAIAWGGDAAKSILIALIIWFIGRFVIKMLNKFLARMLDRRKVEPSIKSFLKSFVNITLSILLILTVVSALGVNITTFAALLASAGLAVGMALSGNLQNLAGGLIILLFKPFKVGDFIEAQGAVGTVKEIQIFHTIITTVDNKEVYIPNGALSSGSVVNYSMHDLRRVDLTIGVEYGEDIDKVRKVLKDLIENDELIVKDPAYDILLSALSASSVDMQVRMWVKSADYWTVYFGMTEKIYNEFNKQGIGFPFPQLTVHQA